MESTPFMDAVTAQRALLLDDETALEGNATISLETQSDLMEQDVLSYIEDNFTGFITILRYLSKEDQELLLSYYLLAKPQTILAKIHRTTQTLCSTLIRSALSRVGTFILLGPPTEAVMREIFARSGLEDCLKKVPLSTAVSLYSETRNFQKVADQYGLHRPDIRRSMRNASHKLEQSEDSRDKALAAYLQGLLEKASAAGQGKTIRQRAKMGNIYYSDPAILGKFRISLSDEGFHNLFTTRASL